MFSQTQSIGLSQTIGQSQSQQAGGKCQAYIRKALEAFKRIEFKGSYYYTCNVARLKKCDRLGNQKQITMWRTHFFLSSPHFIDVKGVIFSTAPGRELAEFSQQTVESIYVVSGHRKILNPSNGEKIALDEDLVFASSDEGDDHQQDVVE